MEYYSEWEKHETDIFLDLFRPGQNFLDVGANIGYYTCLAAARSPDGQVYAFEPDPDNFLLLQKNIELNNLDNVSASQAALSDKAGTLTLYKSAENLGDHRTFGSNPGGTDRNNAIEITCMTGEEFFANIGRKCRSPRAVKLLAASRASAWLWKYLPWIL